GTVPNGANIDTSTPGTKTFTVNSVRDATGRTSGPRTVTYTVGYCAASGATNVKWHYSADPSPNGGWSSTKTVDCASGAVSIGPQSMQGALTVAPGTRLSGGYVFTLPSNKQTFTATVTNAKIVFQLSCASGSA